MIEASGLAANDAITHGFFTREGGVSDGIYGSLNAGYGSGDDTKKVAENRERIAEKLGVGEAYTEGNSERDWIAKFIETFREARFPHIPDLDEFEKSNQGVYSVPVTEPEIAFKDFRKDPANNPLPTPSGKIEIFSERLFSMNKPEEIPAVPKYITEWESPFGKEAQKFPMQVIGPHYMPRVHSTMDNVDWRVDRLGEKEHAADGFDFCQCRTCSAMVSQICLAG